MDTREQAKKVAVQLQALTAAPEIRRKAAARELGRLEPTDATLLLQDLLLLAREGFDPACEVLPHVVAALKLEADLIPYFAELRRVAQIQDLEAVAALFSRGPPKKQMDMGAAAKADARLFTHPLGHLKTRARVTTDPDELSRLAAASDPSVVRNVLLNPRLTEELVVRIAARRPARPEPLVEIWKSPRWSLRHAVRRALVFNPYLPLDIGSKVVPLLPRADLEELAGNAGIHHALRAQASGLLAQLRVLPGAPLEEDGPDDN